MKEARGAAILSFDDRRQFSITMYLKISRRLHGHGNYKGYRGARSIADEFTCFLKGAIVSTLLDIVPARISLSR